MTTDHLRLRVQALLHNPPEIALTRPTVFPDEQAASYLAQLLDGIGADPKPDPIRTADRIASGMDEYAFPKQLATPLRGVFFGQNPTLRHPLSGATLDLKDALLPTTPDLASQVYQEVLRTLTGLVAQLPATDDEEQRLTHLALVLWRMLPEALAQGSSRVLGETSLWHLMPADGRIPDHSIWDHLSLTAALTTAGIGTVHTPSQTSMLLFTLGPVQSFISAARKTSDLWAGSYLLSYLSWQAIQVICNACGPEAVLFPDLRGQPLVDHWLRRGQGLTGFNALPPPQNLGVATFPNRFFALVPNALAEHLAQQAQAAIQATVEEMGRFALGKIGVTGDAAIPWERQLTQYFNCYWAILPLHRFGAPPDASNADAFQEAFEAHYPGFMDWDNKEAQDILRAFHQHNQHTNVGAVYGRLFRLVDALVGSRKALRNFKALDEPGYRCSLIPTLAAVIENTSDRPGPVRKYWDGIVKKQRRKGRIRAGERLSPIALTKRFLVDYFKEHDASLGKKLSDRFPSTVSMATADFKADVIALLRRNDGPALSLRPQLERFKHKLTALENQMPTGFSESPLPRLAHMARGDDLAGWLAQLDGGWLFTDNYAADQLNRRYGLEQAFDEASLLPVRDALHDLLTAADAQSIDRPSKYYAVLMLDGDYMGRWLSGEQAPPFREMLHPHVLHTLEDSTRADEPWFKAWATILDSEVKRPQAPSQHLAISRALGTFALDLVPAIVEEQHLGRLVYSGGDDVLALVSFRDALPVARALRAAFSGHLTHTGAVDWHATSGYLHDGTHYRLTMGSNASASAGVVFAHYHQALQQVLEQARTAEKHAKRDLARDALAVSVMKRSGETVLTGASWRGPSTAALQRDLVELVQRYAELIRLRLIATRLVYDLEAACPGLDAFPPTSAEPEKPPQPHPSHVAESYRLFLRHAEGLSLKTPRANWPAWLNSLADAHGPNAESPSASEHSPGPKAFQRSVFDATLHALLQLTTTRLTKPHNMSLHGSMPPSPLYRTVQLLDVAQFIGLGGAR